MKLLFLDTETTSLSPTNGQIIEMGAVICTLETTNLQVTVNTKFEELVGLRSEMDDKITRITGITNLELSTAQPLHKIQEKWFDFLQQVPEDVVIVGHSLQFDIDFLKNEGWFLPKNYKFCDTLDISKILLPTCNAVNLEFLVEKLQLEPDQNQLEVLGITNINLLNAHRALYDAITCLNLFQHLLTILKKSNFDPKIYNYILEHFLPLNIILYPYKTTLSTISTQQKEDQSKEVRIYFGGHIIQPTLFDKINRPTNPNYIQKILHYLQPKLPKSIKQLLLQIYVIEFIKQSPNNQSLKIHAKNATEFLFAEQVYMSIYYEDKAENKSALTGIISPFESIISQVKYISENNYKLTEFINLLELYFDILILEKPEHQLLNQIQEIIACYDFLLLNLQPFWQKSEYYYSPNQLKPEEGVVKQKITELYHLLNRLNPHKLEETTEIISHLKKSIIDKYTSFFDNSGNLEIAPSKKLLFRYQGLQLNISTFVYQFNLNNTLKKTIEDFNRIIVETYLNEHDFIALIKLTGLKQILDEYGHKIQFNYLNIDYKLLIDESKSNVKLIEFLEERKEIVDLENKYSLLLCGQNSGIKEMERAFTEEYEPSQYLVLGESGSLTKIVSKMIKNQKGLVAIKNGDFYYLSRYLDQIEIAEIWIVNLPYFAIHKYWQNLAVNSTNKDEYIQTLKWLYLKSQAGFISAKSGLNVHFLKSYRV